MRQRCAAGSWHLVVVGLFLGACASTGRGAVPRSYAQTADSPSNACKHNPLYCAVATGREPAATGASLAGVLKLFEDENKERAEQVGVDSKGQPVTRAMTLGTEKHQVAFRCIQERLSRAWPDGFSLEPRYRYDLKANRTTLVSEEEARMLLRQNRSGELRNTIRPDVVIHSGDPLRALAVYDLKFQCPGSNEPQWRKYKEADHPFDGFSQRDIYAKALAKLVAMVAPYWGIIP